MYKLTSRLASQVIESTSVDEMFSTKLRMATIRVPPIQVQTDGYIYVFEDNEEAGDFRVCAIGTDMAYCEFWHAVISKLPIRPDRREMNVAGLYKRKLAMRAKQCRTLMRDQRGVN